MSLNYSQFIIQTKSLLGPICFTDRFKTHNRKLLLEMFLKSRA